MNRYYLVVDESTQWFFRIIEVDHEDEIITQWNIPAALHSGALISVCEREVHFRSRKFKKDFYADFYYGWTISKKEFESIKRQIELHPNYMEYVKNMS